MRERRKAADEPEKSEDKADETKDRSLPPPSSCSLLWLLQLLVVGGVAGACYINSLEGEMLMDDEWAIVRNADVRPQTPLSDVFKHDFWGKDVKDSTSHKSYRPLVVWSYRYNFEQGELNPFGYHLGNVILHAATSLLFAVNCRSVVRFDDTAAFVCALLFATHPVHTDAVSSIVGRADVMSGFFFNLSLSFYAFTYRGAFSVITHLLCLPLSFFFAICALLSKEVGFFVLPVALVCDFVHTACDNEPKLILSNLVGLFTGKFFDKKAFLFRTVLGLGGFLAIALLRLQFTGSLEFDTDVHANPAAFAKDFLTRALTFQYYVTCYVWASFNPFATLCCEWGGPSIPLVESWSDKRNVGTALVYLGLLLSICYVFCSGAAKYSRSAVALSIAFAVVPFIISSNLIFTVGTAVAERILYIPSMGACMLVVALFCKHSTHGTGKLPASALALLVVLVVVCGGRTFQRDEQWQSTESLFCSGIDANPLNPKMYIYCATAVKKTDLAKSVDILQNGLKVTQSEDMYNNLANGLQALQRMKEAEEMYLKSIALARSQGKVPGNSNAHFNLGVLYLNTQRAEKAAEHFETYVNFLSTASVHGHSGATLEQAQEALDVAIEHARHAQQHGR